jgi:hypothetical protein
MGGEGPNITTKRRNQGQESLKSVARIGILFHCTPAFARPDLSPFASAVDQGLCHYLSGGDREMNAGQFPASPIKMKTDRAGTWQFTKTNRNLNRFCQRQPVQHL